ncbi:hypothetical protein M422DRAFT_152646 [Sphaerobolus stellatus SS14]|nr:hypothetical protein M422DRAFT_152646 [Sphaerobolus stellatus SS14]
MPRITERQATANALLESTYIQLVAQALQPQRLSASSDEESEVSSDDDEPHHRPLSPALVLIQALLDLYSSHFINERNFLPRSGELLALLPSDYKAHFPETFRSFLRVYPATFDSLVSKIQDHPVFHNDSHNGQIPVTHQAAITLYRFGHFGNAASASKVSFMAGVGYGTVHLCTRQVMAAILNDSFRLEVLRWPDDEAKEEAKQWVKERTCSSWQHGWCMVDGTLVPLYAQPAFFGNSFFDRKSNYSMNVQIISLPNLIIIDFGVGLPGSQHDATAWKETRIPKEHATLLAPGEWVWGDSAYLIKPWCQAPYKKYVRC